ncbi:MAG: hypothetical protein RBS37_06040 [Bacteroidales bacterium]|jgi:hypothetical protein|nr:hypothetical protein [Bacteroidales bacterium]
MKVNIIKLLEFYDVYRADRAVHVTAITAFLGVDLVLGILRHYFEGEGYECRITTTEPSASGSRHRLDRWIVVTRDGSETWYQTEVKNWSVYTAGVPRTLTPGMSARALNDYAYAMYEKQWNKRSGTFTDFENLAKVFLPMDPPDGFIEGVAVARPLVCYWYPIVSSIRLRLASHFFTLSSCSPIFPEVDIFSVSLYLRHLASRGTTSIDINPGRFTTTLNHVNEITPPPPHLQGT